METGGNLPSLADNLLLLILIIFAAADLLTAIILHVYRYLLEKDIIIPGGEDRSDSRPASEKLLDDPALIGKLHIADRFLTGITGSLAVVYFIRILPCEITVSVLCLYVFCAILILILLESAVTAITGDDLRKTADSLAGLCGILTRIFTPLYLLTEWIIPEPVMAAPTDIEEEESHLRDWVENIPENTILEQDEKKMIRSIVHFSNTMIREIMVPRVEVDALELETPLDEAARLIRESGHSRLPVYNDEIDTIVGVLYAKDVLQAYVEERHVTLSDLMRQPLFVPESKMAGDLLNEMKSSGIHMAVVVDEYGGTSGIVSMEDIVEEIVGEIRDEYDEQEDELVREIGPDEYSFLGRIDLEDVNEYLGTHLTRDSADTLAGYLYSQIGKVPELHETVDAEGWSFEIEELKDKRIRRVQASRKPVQEEKEEVQDDKQ
ncbi:MAG: HlyC/CorC family transporter [Anaerolineaceae bacterium]|nr:HlyC/CorC family transporter [Anaerolineaceae bacterium]